MQVNDYVIINKKNPKWAGKIGQIISTYILIEPLHTIQIDKQTRIILLEKYLDLVFEVYKYNNIVYRGTDFDCCKFLLTQQPQSCHYAERWGGWKIKQKRK